MGAPDEPASRAPRAGVVHRPGEEPGPAVLARARRLAGSPDAAVASFVFSASLDDLHVELAAHGRLDAILDVCAGASARGRLELLVTHLRPGGLLVLGLTPDTGPTRKALALLDEVDGLQRSDEELEPPRLARDTRDRGTKDLHALASSIEELERSAGSVTVRAHVDLLATVPERRMEEVLARAPGIGRVLVTRPPSERAPRGRVRSNTAKDVRERPVHGPALTLREYHDVTCHPRMVLTGHDLVLPDTFRRPVGPRPATPVLVDWSRFAVLPPEPAAAATTLDGPFFYLDNFLQGHFGHAMTEQLAKTWGWPEALAAHPDLRALLLSRDGRVLSSWEGDLLAAAGIPRERVVMAEGPVRVTTVLAATAGYAIAQYLHPTMEETYDAVGARLVAASTLTDGPRRLFVTRHDPRRRCTNQAEVEFLFEQAGFSVVAPEDHCLADQVALFDGAEVVAGFGGSGLFQLALTTAPKQVLVISSENYHIANERMISALRGHDLTVLRCEAEVVAGDQFSVRAFHSDYTFDLAGSEGLMLRDFLAGLETRGAS